MLVLEKIPFFILSLVFGIIAILSQQSGGAMSDTTSFPLSVRLLNAVVSYRIYL